MNLPVFSPLPSFRNHKLTFSWILFLSSPIHRIQQSYPAIFSFFFNSYSSSRGLSFSTSLLIDRCPYSFIVLHILLLSSSSHKFLYPYSSFCVSLASRFQPFYVIALYASLLSLSFFLFLLFHSSLLFLFAFKFAIVVFKRISSYLRWNIENKAGNLFFTTSAKKYAF